MAQRLRKMGELAREGADTELATFLCRRGVAELPSGAPLAWNALALCALVRRLIRYQTEDPETLVGLEALLWLGAGDCDDVSIALAALLLRCGWPVRWLVGFQGDQGVHVWLQTRVPEDGAPWLDCDPSTWRVEPGVSPMVLGELDRAEAFNLAGQPWPRG